MSRPWIERHERYLYLLQQAAPAELRVPSFFNRLESTIPNRLNLVWCPTLKHMSTRRIFSPGKRTKLYLKYSEGSIAEEKCVWCHEQHRRAGSARLYVLRCLGVAKSGCGALGVRQDLLAYVQMAAHQRAFGRFFLPVHVDSKHSREACSVWSRAE